MARLRSKKQSAARLAQRRTGRRAPQARAGEAALAAFAHDIRTALTGILALGELLATANLNKRERRWAEGIKDSAEHLASLTTLVIDAAKADAGTLTLRAEEFRPRRLIEALANSLAGRAEAKGLRAEVAVADDMSETLAGDPVRLRAALENLVDNAVKFTEHGVVRLEARVAPAARGHRKLVVTITDSGIGLKPAEIQRLFRRFVQGNVEIARRYGGAGLGLAVVKRLAKLMGGDLTVMSAPGRGSSFRFTAVLAIAPAAPERTLRPHQKAAPARPLAILCAEDNPYGRVILNTILGELGHRLEFVGSGEEAVAAVAAAATAMRAYDMLLMDVTLAGVDGLEATRRIRALAGAAGRTPIIGISGRTEPDDEQKARAAGMNGFLRKPLSPSTLSEALAAVVPAALMTDRHPEGGDKPSS